MDDKNGLGAVARGLLVLVGPAAVIGEGFPPEKFRIVRRRLVGEQDQHFALDVHAFEVIPMEFGRHDSVADEDCFGVELIRGLLQFADADVIVQPSKRDRFVGARGRERSPSLRGGADHRNGLEVRPVLARGLRAGCLELRRDIFGGQFFAGSSHAAAFQFVAGEVFDVGPHAVAGNVAGFRAECGYGQRE